jgi:antitoxin ParD1/3/4
MNVSLTPELEAFVHQKVASGRYNSASEVIRESLRLLEEEGWVKERRMEEIKKEVLKGYDQIRNGEYLEFKDEEELRKYFEEKIKKGRERLRSKKGIG